MIAYLLKPLPAAIIALMLYGSWAGFSNANYGALAIFKAFLIQGLFAFSATLLLGALAGKLYRKLNATLSALALSFIICMLIAVCVPGGLHHIFGTAEILQSMLPGLIIGNFYILALLITEHKKTHA